MTRCLRASAGRLLAAAAFLWLSALAPAVAAELGRAPEAISGADVLADMRLQLDALSPLSPSRDLAAALWRAYSIPNLSPSRALAASLLMGALAKPQTLPALAPALARASAAQKTGKTNGKKIAAGLSAAVEKYQNDPQSLRAVRVLIAPLRRTLARRTARRGIPEDLKPLWNAVFDGTAPRPPPSSPPPARAAPERAISGAGRALAASGPSSGFPASGPGGWPAF